MFQRILAWLKSLLHVISITETAPPATMAGRSVLFLSAFAQDGHYLVISAPSPAGEGGEYIFHSVSTYGPSEPFNWERQFQDTSYLPPRWIGPADRRPVSRLYLVITSEATAFPHLVRVYLYEQLVGQVYPPLAPGDWIVSAAATHLEEFTVVTRQGRQFTYQCSTGSSGVTTVTLIHHDERLGTLAPFPLLRANIFSRTEMLVEASQPDPSTGWFWYAIGNVYAQGISDWYDASFLGRRWWLHSWSASPDAARQNKIVITGDSAWFRLYFYPESGGNTWTPLTYIGPDGTPSYDPQYIFGGTTDWDFEAFGVNAAGPLWIVKSLRNSGLVETLRVVPDVVAKTFRVYPEWSRSAAVKDLAWYHLNDGIRRHVEIMQGGRMRVVSRRSLLQVFS